MSSSSDVVKSDEYRCPECLGPLQHAGAALQCTKDGLRFPIDGGIVDFRTGTREYYFNPVPSDRMRAIVDGMSAETWAHSVREFLLGMPAFNPDWLDNLVADGRYSWKYLLDLGPDKRVLDLGCGLGNLTRCVAPHVKKVYALDLTRRRLEFSRERFAIFNRDDDIALLAAGDRQHLPFPDASLDCVVLSGVLEWVGEGDTSSFDQGSKWQRLINMIAAHFGETNPRRIQLAFLREIRRVLKPGGQLFIGIENRLNHEYFTGRPDHHSQLKYGSLLPRLVSTLYSIAKNRTPYRTYTYSLGGYRRLLGEAGFGHQEFFGLSRGYSHLEEIRASQADMPELHAPTPSGWRERIKGHPLFVPAYGIIADNRSGKPVRMQDEVLARVHDDLVNSIGPGDTILTRYVVTPKDKLMMFARHGDTPVLIKIPCNDVALSAESANARMLADLRNAALQRVVIPLPAGAGQHQATTYFVETLLPGDSLATPVQDQEPVQLLDQVGEWLDALADPEAQHTQWLALDGDLYDTEVGQPLQAVLNETPDAMRGPLSAYFADALRGHKMLVGPCHGDMGVNNLLVNGGALSGLIDWEAGRLRGLCILDSLSFLLSLHHLEFPDHRVAQSVPGLAAADFRHEAHARFLADRYTRCGVDKALHAPLTHLAWLHMAAQHLSYGLAYNPVAVEEFVLRIVRHILGR